MEIPRKVHVGDKIYVVLQPAKMRCQSNGNIKPDYGVINVAHCAGTVSRTPEQRAETFWHELTHGILHDMGAANWDDEVFVRAFSSRLAYAIQTAEF